MDVRTTSHLRPESSLTALLSLAKASVFLTCGLPAILVALAFVAILIYRQALNRRALQELPFLAKELGGTLEPSRPTDLDGVAIVNGRYQGRPALVRFSLVRQGGRGLSSPSQGVALTYARIVTPLPQAVCEFSVARGGVTDLIGIPLDTQTGNETLDRRYSFGGPREGLSELAQRPQFGRALNALFDEFRPYRVELDDGELTAVTTFMAGFRREQLLNGLRALSRMAEACES